MNLDKWPAISTTILSKYFTDWLQNIGDLLDADNFYRCRLQIPPILGSVMFLNLKNEKSAQRGSFQAGYPADIRGVIRADIPAQNFGQGPRNPVKTSIWARTSMTRRRGRPRPQGIFKNFGQKNFGLNFRSLKSTDKSPCASAEITKSPVGMTDSKAIPWGPKAH